MVIRKWDIGNKTFKVCFLLRVFKVEEARWNMGPQRLLTRRGQNHHRGGEGSSTWMLGHRGGWQEPGKERVSRLPHKPWFPDLQDRHGNSPPRCEDLRCGKGLVSHLVSALPPSPLLLGGQPFRSSRQIMTASTQPSPLPEDTCCRDLALNWVHSDTVNPALQEGLMWEQQRPPVSFLRLPAS